MATTQTTTPDEAFDSSHRLISEALGQRIAKNLGQSSQGVLVESPPQFEPEWFINALDRSTDHTIGLAAVNIDEVDITALQTAIDGTKVRASDELATAIEWRNEEDTGFSWDGELVPDRIVVLVRGNPARLNSLHRLFDLPLGEIQREISSIMSHRPEFAENPSVQRLFEILGDGTTVNVSTQALSEYCINSIQSSSQASIEALGENLHHLGLFPDGNLLSEEIEERLSTNNGSVSRVLHLSNRDRRRLMNSIQKEDNSKEEQAQFVERLRRFQRTHDASILSELDFETVKETLETTSKSITQTPSSTSDQSDNSTDTDDSSSGSDSQRGRRYDRRHDDSAVGVELTFDGEQDEITEIAESLANELPDKLEEDEERTEISFGDDSKIVVDLDADVYHFLQRFVDAETFGGIVENVEDRSEALENIGSLPTTKFCPRDKNSSIDKLRAFAERNPKFEPVISALETYFESRSVLVESLPQLVHSPLIALLGDEDLLNAAVEYLDDYQLVQDKLDKKYRALQDASPSGAVELLSEFLLYDTIVLETEAGREMILSPLHPLHLWKYVELATEVQNEQEALTQDEKEFLEESVEEQPHVLNNVSVGGGKHLDQETYLIQSDELQRLPIYTEATQAEPGTNNELWDYLIERFSSAYPPSASRMKLTVVDPLNPSNLLQTVSRAAQSGQLGGATIEFCYVQTTHRDILSGATAAQEEDILTVFGPRSDFDGFTVRTREERSLKTLAAGLDSRPQHCVVVNDNGTFDIEEFERDPHTSIHPLYVPKEFDYDEFQDEIQISASTEGQLFSEFQNLVNQLFNTRTKLHKSGVHDLQITEDITESFLENSIWTVISTPSTNIDPFWESNLISKERRGDRNYGIYSRDFELFTRTLNRLLREYPIAPDDVDTDRLARRIAELQNSGLLRLITEETLGQTQSSNTQGLLGSVMALQWLEEQYEDPKLIFSIDDPRTRRWLNFGDANRRADFVVAQIGPDSGIDLYIVEVKTLSEPDTAFEVDKTTDPATVSGSAVNQVTETVETIRGLFDGDENVTKQPRREALREQLYYELIGADIGAVKSDWVTEINRVFRGDSELTVHPHIVSVELNESADSIIKQNYSTETAQAVTVSRLRRRTIVRLIMNGNDVEIEPETKETSDQPQPITESDTSESPAEGKESTDSTLVPDEAEPCQTSEDTQLDEMSNQVGEDSATSTDDEQPDPDEEDSSIVEKQSFGNVEEYTEMTADLQRVISEFGINVRDVPQDDLDIGPNVIRYKVELSPGEEQGKLQKRAEDIARELALDHEPIIHRISGTHFVAVDIPRTDRQVVHFYEYLDQLPEPSEISVGQLPYIAGIEPSGAVKVADLQEAPHMLVGGATGSGKTVFLQSLLASLIERQPIDNTEFAIIDPKQTDFVFCNNLPNLKQDQVITDSQEAFDLFKWIVEAEIPRRTEVLRENNSVDINDHNSRTDNPITPLVVIIDEYADLLDSLGEDSDEFETQVRRIAQRARNVGIHLVIATQRPSAKIINTDLRANLNVRVGFRVPSGSDSQVILDETGAEGLTGYGDMLFKEADNTVRLQGTLIEPDELRDLVVQFS